MKYIRPQDLMPGDILVIDPSFIKVEPQEMWFVLDWEIQGGLFLLRGFSMSELRARHFFATDKRDLGPRDWKVYRDGVQISGEPTNWTP